MQELIVIFITQVASSSAMPGPGLSNQCVTGIIVKILTGRSIFFSARERRVSE